TLNNVLSSIDGISQNNIEVLKEMKDTNSEVTNIVKMIEEIENKTKIINDIVFQTKLLSFNASVEAARAGEHGKGFSVVAEEIGKLSKVSGQAAEDISKLLNEGISKIKKIVEDSSAKVNRLSHEGKLKLDSSLQIVNESKKALDTILSTVENIKDMVNEISVSSVEQSKGVQDVSSSFTQIENSVKDNSQIAETSKKHAITLRGQSDKLATIIQEFLLFIEGDNADVSEFQWNEIYRLEVDEMDNEHMTLIEKMNKFLISLNLKNLDNMKEAFSDLANYTIEHFTHEEAYLESIEYPEIVGHKKIHKDLLAKVMEYKEGLDKGKIEKAKISIFLKNWLAMHIVGQDKRYAKHSKHQIKNAA
ncbi:MAG: bacteriohemerythrin, partial [Bdellovibrionales bacterium]